MKMKRNDVKVNRQQVEVKNAYWIGFSSGILRAGQFFTFRDENGQIKLARMHYKLAELPANEQHLKGFIVAQVAHVSMQFTMERWINPADVTETIPAERMHSGIVAFFEHAENQQ